MNAHKFLLAASIIVSQLVCALPSHARVIRTADGELSAVSKVHAYQWLEEGDDPKAAVVIVHGFTQQGLSVDALAQSLARRHYLVVSMDQRGHGRWYRDKQNPDSAKADYHRSMDDLDTLCQTIKQQHQGLPLFCVGESCGSALVTQAVARDAQMADGMVLCSPGTRPRIYNPLWVMRDLACNVLRLNHPVDLRRYIKRYASDDPRVIEEMLHDPLAKNDMSTRELFRTLALIRRTPRAAKHVGDDMPVLLVQGSQDHVLAPNTVPSLLRRFKTANKEVLILPGCGHVLLGTSYIRPVVSDGIAHWLDSQVSVQVSDNAQIAHNSRDDSLIAPVQLTARR